MLLQLFNFLHRNKLFTGLLIVAYSLAIILLHDTFVNISIVVMNKYSLPVYNDLVRNLFGGVGIMVFLFLLIKTVHATNRVKLLIYLFSIAFFIGLHASFLFEMNIEIIHAIEFAVLALLMFAFTGRFGAAVVFCIPVMLIDEYRQYMVLYPQYTLYFEFNDIVMDVLGCGFAMITLKIFGVEFSSTSHTIFYKRSEFIFLSSFLFLFLALLLTCVFSSHINTACSHTIFPLSRLENPELFWQTHAFTKAKYHVLSPISGAIILTGLCVFFLGLDGYSSSAKTSPSKIV
jgi:hypothetical protein